MRSIGLGKKLREIDEYLLGLEKYMREKVNVSRAPRIYRKMRGKPIYAANEDYTCVLVALNTMITILKINFSFNSEMMYKFGGKNGFKYSKLRKRIEYQKKMLKERVLSLDGAKYIRTKNCQ